MRDAARAAAGQHQPHRPPGHQPREPLDVAVVADMVMHLEVVQREPVGRALDGRIGRPQQRKVDRPDRFRRAVEAQRVERRGLGSARRHQQQGIGLAQAELGPRRRARLGEIDDEVMLRLDLAEPVERPARRELARDADHRMIFAERVAELFREAGGIDLVAAGDDRERALERLGRARALRRPETGDQRLGDGEERAGMALGEGVPFLLGDGEDFRVAQAAHRGRARLAADEAHLAHGLARTDAGDEALVPHRVGADIDAERAADDDEQLVRRVALLDQGLSAERGEPGETIRDFGEFVLSEIGKRRNLRDQRDPLVLAGFTRHGSPLD